MSYAWPLHLDILGVVYSFSIRALFHVEFFGVLSRFLSISEGVVCWLCFSSQTERDTRDMAISGS